MLKYLLLPLVFSHSIQLSFNHFPTSAFQVTGKQRSMIPYSFMYVYKNSKSIKSWVRVTEIKMQKKHQIKERANVLNDIVSLGFISNKSVISNKSAYTSKTAHFTPLLSVNTSILLTYLSIFQSAYLIYLHQRFLYLPNSPITRILTRSNSSLPTTVTSG